MRRRLPALSRDAALALRAEHYAKVRFMAWHRLRSQCCRECRHSRFEVFLTADCGTTECDAVREQIADIGAGEILRTVYDGRPIIIAPDGTVTEDQ